MKAQEYGGGIGQDGGVREGNVAEDKIVVREKAMWSRTRWWCERRQCGRGQDGGAREGNVVEDKVVV